MLCDPFRGLSCYDIRPFARCGDRETAPGLHNNPGHLNEGLFYFLNVVIMEKQNLTPGSEATRETRPHFKSLEAWHEYNKKAREAEQPQTIKSLEIYKAHTAKATEALKSISEGLRASMGLGWLPNQLDLSNGAYNPKFIDWLEGYLTNTALALSEILTYDDIEDRKGYIQVWKEKAVELITDVQYGVGRFKDEAYNITYALEYYNYYRGFIEETGLKDDFTEYVNALYLAKG